MMNGTRPDHPILLLWLARTLEAGGHDALAEQVRRRASDKLRTQHAN